MNAYDELKRKSLMSAVLSNAIEMRREFIRKISHELRSPLNTTSISLEMLADLVDPHNQELQEIFDVCALIYTPFILSTQ
jgi:signal transduction histidine kinase